MSSIQILDELQFHVANFCEDGMQVFTSVNGCGFDLHSESGEWLGSFDDGADLLHFVESL